MAEGPAISIERLGKRFGNGPPVIRDLSLTASGGQMVAVIGPSGCGKSTLLRIIAGLIAPSSGAVRSAGPALRPAFIFQDATLLPWASVMDNISVPLRLKGTPRAERERTARVWAGRVGLENRLAYFPRQLSGGMRMRVSIARALSLQPNLLLLDEPFGALDAITRNRLNEELLALRDENPWTGFFVTHSVTEAVFLSDRVVILGNRPDKPPAVIENPLPFPRVAQLRESLAFQQRVAEATACLQEVLYHEPAGR